MRQNGENILKNILKHLCGLLLTVMCHVVMWSLHTGAVTADRTLTAEVGRPLLLGCNITTASDHNLRQVRWYNQHNKILLAYEQSNPVVFSHQDPGVHLTTAYRNSSYITIKEVRPDNEGCYRCIFDVYPVGSQEAVTCVSVTG